MPPLVNAVPKYRKHKATGQAVVTLSGQDFYLGPHGTEKSRKAYDRLIREWIAADRKRITKSADLTIAEVCQRYKKYVEDYYGRHSGTTHNIASACRVLRHLYGNTTASEFGPLALKTIRQQFVEAKHSRKYCNRLTHLVRQMFKWASSEQVIPVTTWQALTTIEGLRFGHTAAHENKPITSVPDSIVDATLPHLPETVADMVRLERLTGMRPDEVCRLRPCELDRSAPVWSYSPSHHKTAHHGRNRVVFIGPRGQDVLLPYLLRDAETNCFVPAEVTAKQLAIKHAKRKTPLSCGNVPGSNRIRRRPKRTAGNRYSVNSYRRAIHRACDLADKLAHRQQPDVSPEQRLIPQWSPNRLRHSTATEIRKQFGLEAAQVVLGHSLANVTQIYAERDLAKAASIMQEVG